MTGWVIAFIIYSILYFLLTNRRERNGRMLKYSRASKSPSITEEDIIYNGKQNEISKKEIHKILDKRYSYFASLEPILQEKFLNRVENFINKKIFIIKDDEGYREMPVLVSAAAIQLTFGLTDYLLPFYKFIRIYPKEYMAENALKILAGNVQDNTITVAWNQFLKGFADLSDGSNVGLHEMSHALYFQRIVIDGNFAKGFCTNYNCLLSECSEAYKKEIAGRQDLYSEYADTNLQEFWAETVELFFEKPIALKKNYPSVYETMKLLLNQDPVNKKYPLSYKPNIYFHFR